MKTAIRLSAIVGAIAWFIQAAPARAEEWAPVLTSDPSIRFEVDLSQLSRNGDIVQSWSRETYRRPKRDAATGKSYVVALLSRRDDCKHARFEYGAYVRRDAKGAFVSTATRPFDGSWTQTVPGSVGEALGRIACKASEENAEEALLPDILAGQWERLGLSSQGKSYNYVNFDEIYDLGHKRILVYSRADYIDPINIEGLPIRYILMGLVIDCEKRTYASLGADHYFSPTIRLDYQRTDLNKLELFGFTPGSFLMNHYQRMCASAKPLEDEADDAGKSGGFGVGTAWGVTKGYLVTAAHVVAGGKAIGIFQNGEHIGDARVVAGDPANDLAILKLAPAAGVRLSVLELSDRPAALGRSVFTLGFPQPGVLGQAIKMTAGEVSSTSGYQDDARFLQISVPVQPGNSGGPVLGWDGKVLGVVAAKLSRFDERDAGPRPENVNYAVKVAYVRPMLEDLPDLGGYTVLKPTGGGDQLISLTRRAVYMVVVQK